MKKLTLFLFLAISVSQVAFAQSGRIRCIAYKEIHYSGAWEKWPDYWTTYASEGRTEPTLQITTAEVLESGNIYRVQLINNGDVQSDFYVLFDSGKTTSIRSDWDKDDVNCYIDKNGDYIFTEGVSLESLAKDSTVWAVNKDSQMYFMIYSSNYAVVVK